MNAFKSGNRAAFILIFIVFSSVCKHFTNTELEKKNVH